MPNGPILIQTSYEGHQHHIDLIELPKPINH